MKNKVALVTGATGGIGSAVYKALTRKYRLSLFSRSMTPKDTDDIFAFQCDVTREDQVKKAVVNTIRKFGKIDVLVNCAGLSHLGRIEEVTQQDIRTVYDTNVMGTVNVCQAVLPYMLKQKSGYIINIGSLRGIHYGVGKSVYAMSKSAVIVFSKTLNKESFGDGIRVTVINPGFVDTDLYGKTRIRPFTVSLPKGKLKKAALTLPDDIAKTVLYLLALSPGAEIDEINIGRLWGIE